MVDNSDNTERLFQIVFDLPRESSTWPPVHHERLWAAKTEVKRHLALRNVPFYCRGVAYGDIILARPDLDRRELVFEELVAESGHSVLQIVVMLPGFGADLDRILSGFGLWWETSNGGVYCAVDVKPEADYAALRSELMKIKGCGGIGIQEATISERHRDQSSE